MDRFSPASREEPFYVTVVQFSKTAKIEVKHALITTGSSDIVSGMKAISQMRDITLTYTALKFVNTNVYPLLRNSSKKVLVTLTDTDASRDDTREALVVARAHANFDSMIAVAIGDDINSDLLLDISSDGNILHIRDFAELEGTDLEIFETACESIKNGKTFYPHSCGISTYLRRKFVG